MTSRVYIVFLLCFGHFFTVGQFNNFKFENLETVDGLSSSTCLTIFQDKEGFLWFVTINGLNKYNGYKFEIYKSVLNDTVAFPITAKHHDGFSIFDTNSSDLNIVDATPFRRDALKELAQACQEQNIKFGFYYSQTENFHHPDSIASVIVLKLKGMHNALPQRQLARQENGVEKLPAYSTQYENLKGPGAQYDEE